MNLAEVLYDWSVEAGRVVLPRVPLLPEKARRSVAGRRGLVQRIESWAAANRGDGRLIWFHAPSVGEGLQTRPVIEAMRAARPDIQIFYTFFSPSAEMLGSRMPADHADYMPFDVTSDLSRVMEALRPDVIVFGKADVWPNITRVACWRGIPMALVSATLAPNSSRLRWPARALLAPAYGRLDAVGAISEDDAGRLASLGVPWKALRVTGDARFDQVWRRAHAVDHTRPPLSLLDGHAGITLVAGSTWREDERRLVPAVAGLRRRHPSVQAILVPHEPTTDHLMRLEADLEIEGLPSVRLSLLEAGAALPEAIVLVDRTGVLGELYDLADVAYVGGGFGKRGLHSVLEPAALAAPVLFGPHHANAREAGELIGRGGAVAVPDGTELERVLGEWLDSPDERRRVGDAALSYVKEGLGAGRRNADLVLGLLDRLPPD
jgi:3-deoxy-D-manno-octulosonic-acid transferase